MEISPQAIRAKVAFDHAPLYAGLEAMAQTAALHVRHLLDFERHAFLLKVQHCRIPEVEFLTGTFVIAAEGGSKSSSAYAYNILAKGAGEKAFKADVLIGTRDYDDRFDQKILMAHYRKVLAGLKD